MTISKATIFVLGIVLASASGCGPGGVLCPSGSCHFPAYIEGCYIYQSSASCYQCEHNYIKNGNICEYSPPVDNSKCCESYSYPSGQCEKCAPGLALRDGGCQEVKIIGCLGKSKSGDCVNCAIEYELLGGRCVKKINGCLSYTASRKCDQCDKGYQLENGFCLPEFVIDQGCHFPFIEASEGGCLIPGCQAHCDYGCADCEEDYRLLPDGSCHKGVIEGCEVYENNGLCKECKSPVYTKVDGLCFSFGCLKVNSNGGCTQCDRRKGFELKDGYCTIKNCAVSSAEECLVCEPGYVESSGLCRLDEAQRICTVCNKNEFLGSNGVCSPRQKGCISYHSGRCSGCEKNLYLSDEYICLRKEPGCIYEQGYCASCRPPFKKNREGRCEIKGCTVHGSDKCEECVSPYVLTVSGGCSFKNCYEVVEQRCAKCFEGFRIRGDGKCHTEDKNCQRYTHDGVCIKCISGYYLDGSSSCKRETVGCNYIDGRCVSCRAPFEYNPVEESCHIDGCLEYFIGGCQVCAVGYDLRYNSCKLPNCLISHKGHCRECDPDYIMRSDGRCVSKDEFCWKYNDEGFCTECAPKYFLSHKTNKCKPREPGCHYNSEDRCKSCDEPFYFDGVRCEIYGCLELSHEGCSNCFYPFEVTNAICEIPNCQERYQNQCIQCREGFFIAKDGSCRKGDDKCLKYGKTSCEKCVKGYRVDYQGICEYADEHCWDFSAFGNCVNCDRLYFLNSHFKCEIKDARCQSYSGGKCIECYDSFYLHRGLCYPNSEGCLKQKNIKKCQRCADGYDLQGNHCILKIKKLSWNSFDMDFWADQSDANAEESKNVFSVGKTNKMNLDAAIAKGKGKVNIVYSSIKNKGVSFQVDDRKTVDGWRCDVADATGEYVGIDLDHLETFYAVEIRIVKGNNLKRFAIQFSEDGVWFKKVQQFRFRTLEDGIVETFYFTPVEASSMRIVVLEGSPNIKFDFYYSNGENKYAVQRQTYVYETTEEVIVDNIQGEIFHPKDDCIDKELCWMGVEVCEPREIKGFSINPNADCDGAIETVVVKFSRDGVEFNCYADCKEIFLHESGSYLLDPSVVATKLRVYPTKWTGSPSYSVTFNY